MHTPNQSYSLVLLLAVLSTVSVASFAAQDDKKHKDCVKPKLYNFTPTHLSEVIPGAPFSFLIYHLLDPSELRVTVKGQPVAVKLTDKKQFYKVEGNFPTSLSNTFARVDVTAGTLQGCVLKTGWLFKITALPNAEAATQSDTESAVPAAPATPAALPAPEGAEEQKGS